MIEIENPCKRCKASPELCKSLKHNCYLRQAYVTYLNSKEVEDE